MNGRPIKRTFRGTRSTSARSHLPGRETFVGEEGRLAGGGPRGCFPVTTEAGPATRRCTPHEFY